MQHTDDSNGQDHWSKIRCAFEAVFSSMEPDPVAPADPGKPVRISEGLSRLGFSRAHYANKLKAQKALEQRGEAIIGPRLPESHEENGRKCFYQGEIDAYELAASDHAKQLEG